MTKEDKRRMHMSRSAMCSIQNSSIFAHSPDSKSASTKASLYACGSSGIRNYREQDRSLSCLQAFILPHQLEEYLHWALPFCPSPPTSSPAPRGTGSPKMHLFRGIWKVNLSPKEKRGWEWKETLHIVSVSSLISADYQRAMLESVGHQKRNIIIKNSR